MPCRVDLSPGEPLCTTRIAFKPNCSLRGYSDMSRRADRSCQVFPDDIASPIHDGTAPLKITRPKRRHPAGAVSLRGMRCTPRYPDLASWAHNREEVTGRVPTVLFVAKQLAKGEEYVDA